MANDHRTVFCGTCRKVYMSMPGGFSILVQRKWSILDGWVDDICPTCLSTQTNCTDALDLSSCTQSRTPDEPQ